ncbi:MAG: hypothetical protein KBB02_03925, partial [Spirochaetia bacterium]|nr:hypothetical protein [Spirochaetia bacterium]
CKNFWKRCSYDCHGNTKQGKDTKEAYVEGQKAFFDKHDATLCDIRSVVVNKRLKTAMRLVSPKFVEQALSIISR